MISCAKALSAGMQPISALMVNQRIFEAMLDESRKLGISRTASPTPAIR